MSIKASIKDETDRGLNAEFSLVADPQDQIIQIDIRFQNTPDRNESEESPRYEVLTATLEEVIWLRNALNESIREVVGL